MKVNLQKTIKSFYPCIIAGLILLISFPAAATKPKLIVLPITGDGKIAQDDSDYLLDSMFEAASLRIAGEIILITKQGTKKAIKSVSKSCKEDCALSAAQKTGAGIALICDLNTYEDKTIGFVKLLDTTDEAVLSAKRFIVSGNDLRAIEAGMQSAVRYVLSARFLPLSQAQQSALAKTQGNMPPAQYPEQVEGPIMVNIPQADSAASTSVVSSQNQNRIEAYTEPEPEPYVEPLTPEEASVKKKHFLVSAIVFTAFGAGMSLGGMGFLLTAQNEVDKQQGWYDAQNELYVKASADGVSQAYIDLYNQNILAIQDDIETIDKTIKKDNILGAVFLGIGGVSLITSIVFWVKFSKMKKLSEPGMISLNPVFSPNFNGAVLSGSF
ncbi:MAG: hypothetical protein JXR91_06575 [Deltaproteobacteria bacterium]|nr:hypothetical protein [Deltaproteobacteria bacterium]